MCPGLGSPLWHGEHRVAVSVVSVIRQPDQNPIGLLYVGPQFVEHGFNAIKSVLYLSDPLRQPPESYRGPNRRQKHGETNPGYRAERCQFRNRHGFLRCE